MGDKPRAELFSALAHLHQSRDYSDLVIFAKDGSRHPVHRCIICPRSSYLQALVQEGRWREGTEGHITLNDEEPEVVRFLVEYLYLLNYDPVPSPADDASSSHGDFSDTVSVRTEPVQYGHVYGTSAVSAFGGPISASLRPAATAHPPSPPLSTLFRPRTSDSALTVHAMPTGNGGNSGSGGGSGVNYDLHHSSFTQPSPNRPAIPRRRKTPRGMVTNAPEPSPLATAEPLLLLHARIYAAAARYGIEGLKFLALDKFKIQLTRHWDSPEFPEAIHVVYHSTPSTDKDMREAVADTLEWHHTLLDKPEVEVAIMDIDGLAYELLKRSRRAEPEYMD